ncbi:hypothetical protein Q4F19_16220 [Sphingomonas sp. BIUV-7]|uniref:Resolvase HTH domain-containing protein n=1 Tax=Sphingomonas natans TaxID=3063330 RepID=A0ABT8YC73_9SPHN|nr:hypothetical protein [Sphingomonas sp. BIUV-7]
MAIIEDFELGTANGRELASLYHVHKNTVYRLLKAAGAKKGSRALEAIAPLIAALDERDRQAAIQQAEDLRARIALHDAHMAIMERFMARLIEANARGALAELRWC